VARYADAANVFGAPEAIARKYRILEEHCAAVGRDFDEIERTTLQSVAVSPDGGHGTETPAQVVDHFGELGDAGAQHVIFNVRGVHDPSVLELIGRDVIPQLRGSVIPPGGIDR
jgi:alkanesulfonate monooxygenase SsuD/methylene tetrahydromethanopterin reductase-like flavin-dependent oxidoreductase (luciferase family)